MRTSEDISTNTWKDSDRNKRYATDRREQQKEQIMVGIEEY